MSRNQYCYQQNINEDINQQPFFYINNDPNYYYRGQSYSHSQEPLPRRHRTEAHYWATIYNNLEVSIDELYAASEATEDLNRCYEIYVMLHGLIRDFSDLADWLKSRWSYTQSQPQRTTHFFWEGLRQSRGSRGHRYSSRQHYRKQRSGLDSSLHNTAPSLLPALEVQYWSNMYNYLELSIDELYVACEATEDNNRCYEIYLILHGLIRDFSELADWLKLQWSYTQSQPQRTTHFFWEGPRQKRGTRSHRYSSRQHYRKRSNSVDSALHNTVSSLLPSVDEESDVLNQNSRCQNLPREHINQGNIITSSGCVYPGTNISAPVFVPSQTSSVKYQTKSEKRSNSKSTRNINKELIQGTLIESDKEFSDSNVLCSTIDSVENLFASIFNKCVMKQPITIYNQGELMGSSNIQSAEVLEINPEIYSIKNIESDKSSGTLFNKTVEENIEDLDRDNETAKTASPVGHAAETINYISIPSVNTKSQNQRIEIKSENSVTSCKNLTKTFSYVAALGRSSRSDEVNVILPSVSKSRCSKDYEKPFCWENFEVVTSNSKEKKDDDLIFNCQGLIISGDEHIRSSIKKEYPVMNEQERLEQFPALRAPSGAPPVAMKSLGSTQLADRKRDTFIKIRSRADPGAKKMISKPFGKQNPYKLCQGKSIMTTKQQWAGPTNSIRPKGGRIKEENIDEDGWRTVHKGKSRGKDEMLVKSQFLHNSLNNYDDIIQTQSRERHSVKIIDPIHSQTRLKTQLYIKNINSENNAATLSKIGSKNVNETNIQDCVDTKLTVTDPSHNKITLDECLDSHLPDDNGNAVLATIKHDYDNFQINEETGIYSNFFDGDIIINPGLTDTIIERSIEESYQFPLVERNSIEIDTQRHLELEELCLNEEEIRKSHELEAEEKMLNEKIKNLELSEIDFDVENDFDMEENPVLVPSEIHYQYNEYLKTIPWSDQIDEMEELAKLLSKETQLGELSTLSLEQIEELVNTHPVRALELHVKLSNRRKREDSEEKSQARRQKADEKRQKLLNDKAAKMRDLVQKVNEVKAQQQLLTLERKQRLALKLKKAEENRKQHLSTIRKKAHDEEEKLKEIAFINELEAQNRRHESMALRQEQEERLQNILEERQRKVGEKAAKEAAVEERRRLLEAERQEKLEKMQEKRRKKEETIGRKQKEKENERLEIAREKAREREERLQARQAAQIATAEELQKKIQQKQENTARRHEENIELIRQKALETGMLRNINSDDDSFINHNKYSSPEDIARKSGDGRHKNVQAVDRVETLRLKQRKKQNKIKSAIISNGRDYVNELPLKEPSSCSSKRCISKSLKDLNSLLKVAGSPVFEEPEIELFDKVFQDMIEVLENKGKIEMDAFRIHKGFVLMSHFYPSQNNISSKKFNMPFRYLQKFLSLISSACVGCSENAEYFILSGEIVYILDMLQIKVVNLLENKKNNTLTGAILNCLHSIFMQLENCGSECSRRMNDVLSYIISSGLLFSLIDVVKNATVSDEVNISDVLEPTIKFFTCLTTLRQRNTDFEDVLRASDLMGLVSLLYGSLQGPLNILPTFTSCILQFLFSIAQKDVRLFQRTLGAEGVSLQLRHIASFLLSFCHQNNSCSTLLHSIIEIIGYFCVKNTKNQTLLHSGQMPTVLQQLIASPFQYFCEKPLINILYPTLIACCQNVTNRELVEVELSYDTLNNFVLSDEAHTLPLIKAYLNLGGDE